ncbi:hypothetical protein FD755_007643, partial [Muntiacus reevesi]
DQEFLHARRWDLPAGWGSFAQQGQIPPLLLLHLGSPALIWNISCSGKSGLGSSKAKCRTLGLYWTQTWSPKAGHSHSRLARFRVSQATPPACHSDQTLPSLIPVGRPNGLAGQGRQVKGGVWEKQEEGREAVGRGGPRGQMSSIAALEQAIIDVQECDDGEIQLYNEQIDTLRKETEGAERSLERSPYDCRQLVVAQQTLRSELDQYHRIIENTGNRWVVSPLFLSLPIPTYMAVSTYLTRDVQDITAVKPRLKGLPKNLLRKKEMVVKDRADEILEETPLRGPEDTKLERVVLKGGPPTQEGALEDVPDGSKISKDFEKLGKMIKKKVKGAKEPEPPANLGKNMDAPPTPHPADKGDEKNAKELKGLQGKQDGQKEEEGDRRPCPMVAPGPEGLSTPRPQGPQVTLGGSKGHGAQSGSRPKVEVMESIEKFSTRSIQMYEETVVIVETTIEKTRQTRRNWERRDRPVPELTRRSCLWAPADMCFDVLEQRLPG